jgi:SPP1 Gp6-like portal protein
MGHGDREAGKTDMDTVILLDDEQLEAAVKWAKTQLTGDRIEKYRTARKYYDGDQDLVFATTKFSNTFGNLFKTFAYNRCGPVVDAIADRLQLQGFEGVPKPGQAAGPESDAVKETADLIFRLNRMDRRQNDQIQESLKCGDSYAIVWLDGKAPDGTPFPTITIQLADTVVIRYNEDTGLKEYAVKVWQRSDKFWRVNVYAPSAIYKYVTTSKKDDFPDFSNLEPYEAITTDGLTEPWPLPNPTNTVPVFHFNNNAPEGEYGRSELRDVIPLQDALNKACMDMMVAMEYGAFPQRWATGLQLGMPDPITGKIASPFNPGAGEVWSAPQGASFGTFEVSNLDQFLKVQDGFDTKIANVARIPSYWFLMGGTPPSGEMLKTAEAPFVVKIEDRQIGFGNTWEDCYSFALALMGRPGITLNAVWKAAELRSDTDKLQEGVLKLSLGWSEDQIQRDFGLDQTIIDRMKEEKLQKVEEAQAAFNAGMTGTQPSGGGNNPPQFTNRNQQQEEKPAA